MEKTLATSDIVNALEGKTNVYSYDEIKHYNSIDDLLKPYGKAVILYFWKDKPNKFGHWCCIFKTPRDTIEFFDSYGSVEHLLKDIPTTFKNSHGMEFPYLSKLVYDSPYEYEYNDKKLQDNDSNVCGRYVIARLSTTDMPIQKFQKIFNKKPKENDMIVYKLTEDV